MEQRFQPEDHERRDELTNDGAYPGNEIRFPFLLHSQHLRIDLFTQLGLDLARVARKERKKSLRAAVDHVDFVQGDDVDRLFPLLELAFWAWHESSLRWALGMEV